MARPVSHGSRMRASCHRVATLLLTVPLARHHFLDRASPLPLSSIRDLDSVLGRRSGKELGRIILRFERHETTDHRILGGGGELGTVCWCISVHFSSGQR